MDMHRADLEKRYSNTENAAISSAVLLPLDLATWYNRRVSNTAAPLVAAQSILGKGCYGVSIVRSVDVSPYQILLRTMP